MNYCFDLLNLCKPKCCSNFAAIPDDSMSVCSGSMYEEYYPFEYLGSGSGGASVSAEPIYATVTRTDKAPLSPPPLPPRMLQSTLDRKRNTRENWVRSNYQKKKNYQLSAFSY